MRQLVVDLLLTLKPKPLTPSNFAQYGTVVENPARSGSSELLLTAVSANQGTATKYPSITPVINNYELAPTQKSATAKMAMFVCMSRALIPVSGQSGLGCLEIKVLERHPYTTQTFLPLGLSSEDNKTAFVVVVAPTLRHGDGSFDGPDVVNAEAYIANGSQGVTYGVGTWHAPMIVVGEREVEFAVVQYVNGVSEDDCEEVEVVVRGRTGGVEVLLPMLGGGRESKL